MKTSKKGVWGLKEDLNKRGGMKTSNEWVWGLKVDLNREG